MKKLEIIADCENCNSKQTFRRLNTLYSCSTPRVERYVCKKCEDFYLTENQIKEQTKCKI